MYSGLCLKLRKLVWKVSTKDVTGRPIFVWLFDKNPHLPSFRLDTADVPDLSMDSYELQSWYRISNSFPETQVTRILSAAQDWRNIEGLVQVVLDTAVSDIKLHVSSDLEWSASYQTF